MLLAFLAIIGLAAPCFAIHLLLKAQREMDEMF